MICIATIQDTINLSAGPTPITHEWVTNRNLSVDDIERWQKNIFYLDSDVQQGNLKPTSIEVYDADYVAPAPATHAEMNWAMMRVNGLRRV